MRIAMLRNPYTGRAVVRVIAVTAVVTAAAAAVTAAAAVVSTTARTVTLRNPYTGRAADRITAVIVDVTDRAALTRCTGDGTSLSSPRLAFAAHLGQRPQLDHSSEGAVRAAVTAICGFIIIVSVIIATATSVQRLHSIIIADRHVSALLLRTATSSCWHLSNWHAMVMIVFVHHCVITQRCVTITRGWRGITPHLDECALSAGIRPGAPLRSTCCHTG
jgi:hypothetical protein